MKVVQSQSSGVRVAAVAVLATVMATEVNGEGVVRIDGGSDESGGRGGGRKIVGGEARFAVLGVRILETLRGREFYLCFLRDRVAGRVLVEGKDACAARRGDDMRSEIAIIGEARRSGRRAGWRRAGPAR